MIKRKYLNIANTALFALLAALYATSAHASLGGESASVENDRVLLKVERTANLTKSTSGSYTVHETVLPNGTTLRQYVSRADVVFAVTWSGPFMPNLRQILGSHFDTLSAHQSEMSHAGHRYINLHKPDLVIESGGHQRNFFGRAYLPGEVPADVTEQDIQFLN